MSSTVAPVVSLTDHSIDMIRVVDPPSRIVAVTPSPVIVTSSSTVSMVPMA